MRPSSRRVSWSNHLHPDATRIQAEEERRRPGGNPPTGRLTPAFRERMEDVVWALVNSPEFVFLLRRLDDRPPRPRHPCRDPS